MNGDDEVEWQTAPNNFHEMAIKGDLAGIKAAISLLPPSCLKFIINNDRDREDGYKTILHNAAENGHVELVRFLVSKCGANLREKCCDIQSGLTDLTPMHLAVKKGRLEIVKLLCELDPKMATLGDCIDYKPLHLAAAFGHFLIVRFLIEEMNVTVDEKGHESETALMLASASGHLPIVKFLVETCHANVYSRGSGVMSGYSAIHLSAKEDHLNVLDYLLHVDPNLINEKGPDGGTPLHTAIMYDNVRSVKFLIATKNVEINAKNDVGETPFIIACDASGVLDVVKVLLEHGADPTLATKPGLCRALKGDNETGLHRAARFGRLDIVTYLCKFRHDLAHLKTQKGRTPLIFAQDFGQTKVANYLQTPI